MKPERPSLAAQTPERLFELSREQARLGDFEGAAERFWLALTYGVYETFRAKGGKPHNVLEVLVSDFEGGLTKREALGVQTASREVLAGSLLSYLEEQGPPQYGWGDLSEDWTGGLRAPPQPPAGGVQGAWDRALQEILLLKLKQLPWVDLKPARRGTRVTGPLKEAVKTRVQELSSSSGLGVLRKASPFVVSWGPPEGVSWREVWVLEDLSGRRARVAFLFMENSASKIAYEREGGLGTIGVDWAVESLTPLKVGGL
jgi:hypothetical protein